MPFDIYALDEFEDYTEEKEEALYEFQDTLVELFAESPEGKKLQHSETFGIWASQTIYYGDGYIGVTIPQMTRANIAELLESIFPKKISLPSPEEALDAIPEMVAFWTYLKREYKLKNANAILKYLKRIKPREYVNIMNDSSRFGMAKSLISQGIDAGFDMTDEKEMGKFFMQYNEEILKESPGLFNSPPAMPNENAKEREELIRGKEEKHKNKAKKKARRRHKRKKKK